jgi:simple sugar transport system permease protein
MSEETMGKTVAGTESQDTSMAGTTAAGGLPPAGGGAQFRTGSAGWSGSALNLVREAALLPVLVLLVIVGAIVSPTFLTVSNLTGIGQQVSSLGLLVIGESLVLIAGGMDLSLESTYGLAPMVAAWMILPLSDFGNGSQVSPIIGLLILLLVGAAVGVINGLLIVKARLNGFIVTLAMTIILEGLQNGIVKGQTLFNLPPAFTYLGSAQIGSIPVSLIFAVGAFIVVGLFMRYHKAGRAIHAVGGNIDAARAAGISVDRVRLGAFIAAGMLAAVGGLMEAGRVSAVTGQQGYGEGIIFPAFAAAVIGGVSLKGGRGNMLGAATGVLLLGLVQNILNLGNVSSYWIDAINGTVILVALVTARLVGGKATVE